MTGKINFRNKTIHYSDKGKGSVVVLLHGFLESGAIWNKFSIMLLHKLRVIAIDLPGHGQSGCIAPTHSMDMMAEAVNIVLKGLRIRKCIMVGHSMGGYVTMAFAEKYPSKLKGIVLFHSQAGADTPEAQANRERTIRIVENDSVGFIQNFIQEIFAPENVKRLSIEIARLKETALQTPNEGIIAVLRGMKERPDRRRALANFNKPVLFIIGKQDAKIPMQVILEQVSLPAHSEMLLLDHVGHAGMIEESARTAEAVRDFVRRLT
jgi:pimeloyl-ACP methyl ester carboxylesterase